LHATRPPPPHPTLFPYTTLFRSTPSNRISSTALGDHVDELLTVEEVAQLLKVSRSWVYEHTRLRGTPRSERLPHIKLGKYVRFRSEELRVGKEGRLRSVAVA